MGQSRLITSARLLVYINGRLFGRCNSFSINSVTPIKEIETIDVQFPLELAVARVRVGWTMGVLRTIGDGGLQGAGVIAPQAVLSRQRYFTLQIVERQSGLTFFQSVYNMAGSEDWNVVVKQIVAGSVTGSGILWTNETAAG